MLIVRCDRWDKIMTDSIQKQEDQKQANSTINSMPLDLVPMEKRKLLRKQAQELLSGKAKWTPGWTDLSRDGRPLARM